MKRMYSAFFAIMLGLGVVCSCEAGEIQQEAAVTLQEVWSENPTEVMPEESTENKPGDLLEITPVESKDDMKEESPEDSMEGTTGESKDDIKKGMSEETPEEPTDDTLVEVTDYVDGIYVDLKYATEENFTGQVIYDFTDAKLRYGTVKKLEQAQEILMQSGYTLLIWDAYRPVSAQFRLWEICPDPVYVANPTNGGYSKHSRGNTVDITLADPDGKPVEMPTNFDDFTTLADRDYSDVSEPAKSHVMLLEDTMKSCGFTAYFGEWWHFTDEIDYPVLEN